MLPVAHICTFTQGMTLWSSRTVLPTHAWLVDTSDNKQKSMSGKVDSAARTSKKLPDITVRFLLCSSHLLFLLAQRSTPLVVAFHMRKKGLYSAICMVRSGLSLTAAHSRELQQA